jgi:hypothetical protein
MPAVTCLRRRSRLEAGFVCGLPLRRALIDSNGGRVGFAAVAAGVGVVRKAVGLDAPGELQRLRSHLLELGGGHPAPEGREQVLARCLGYLDLGGTGPELLRSELGLIEPSVAFGVGPVRDPVGAHAGSEGERSGLLRRCCRDVGGGVARCCGGAEMRHVTARRAAARRRQQGEAGHGDDGERGSRSGGRCPPRPASEAAAVAHHSPASQPFLCWP